MKNAQLILPIAGLAAIGVALTLPALAETRNFNNLSGFDRVSASAGVTVLLKQGPFAVSVDAPEGKFDQLKLEVHGSTLVAGRKNMSGWNGRGRQYTITVSAPSYRTLEASSGSHLEGSGLRFADLGIDVSSGAHMELSGDCKAVTIGVSSGSHFSGENLKCESASVDASSGAHAEAFATASAKGDASSGAHITFHGKPANVSKDSSSGGSVSSL
jgi:hypothetical protein